jgi:hypothetical protein
VVEQKDVVLAILGATTALGAMLLVFQALLLTIIGTAPLPEETELAVLASGQASQSPAPSGSFSGAQDPRYLEKKRRNVERLRHQFYWTLRIAILFDLFVLLVTFVEIALAVEWLLSSSGTLYSGITTLFFIVLCLIFFEAVAGTAVITLKRVSSYDPS